MRLTTRLLAAGLAIGFLLAAAGYWGYRAYRVSLDKAALERGLDRDAESMEAILKLEAEGASRTYQDVFALCDKSVERRTAFIFEVRGFDPWLGESFKSLLSEYLAIGNELVGFKRGLYRERLNLVTAKELFTEHVRTRSLRRSDQYFVKASSLNADLLKATTGLYRNATQFSLAYSRLLIIERMLAPELAAAQIRFRPIFGRYRDPNMKFIDDLKKIADSVRKSLQ